MQDAVRVEIVPRTVEADLSDPTVVEAERDLDEARATGNVPDTSDAQDAYVRALRAATKTVWVARFGAVDVPLETFDVQPATEGGKALVSLLISADAVQVGGPPTGAASPQVHPATLERKPAVSMWGAAKTDPRANIPGWTPESLSSQVAGNAAGRLA